MKGYGGLDRSLSSAVHFISCDEYADDLINILRELNRRGYKIGYVDYEDSQGDAALVTEFGSQLKLDHHPYKGKLFLLQFLDDLIGTSASAPGLILMVDNAQSWISQSPRSAFDFIKTFLTQTGKWFSFGKPCYLLMQIERDARTAIAFRMVLSDRA